MTTSKTKIRIRRPDDFHVHLRQGEMLSHVVGATATTFGRALVMPNTTPPIRTGADAMAYKARILDAVRTVLGSDWGFEPLMTIKLLPTTTPDVVREARAAGVVAAKLYPAGVTTNSDDGIEVDRLGAIYVDPKVLEAMQEVDMVLCLHGEVPGVFCLDREEAFLEALRGLSTKFPRLRIVLEHVTCQAAVDAVTELPPNVAATITAHHLLLSLDDVVGDKIRPHHFCKPIAKYPSDRTALVIAATSGSRKFFLGTDSAPHARGTKECDSGCAGVYTAPIAMEVLAEVFEQADALERLEGFTSVFGADFYRLPRNEDYVELVKEWVDVPKELPGNLVPFRAGEKLTWLFQQPGSR
jgi:dihydroorotase